MDTGYASRLRAQGVSPATLRGYLDTARAWERHAGADPAAWTQDQAWEYLASPAWGARTRAAYRTRLRAYLTFCGRGDLAAELPAVRVPRGVPRPAAPELVAQALASADAATAALVALGALAGLRRSELAALRWSDVDSRGLTVAGKGGHTRVVPLHPAAAEHLARLRAEQRGGPWVFPSPRGGHLSGHTVYLRIRAAAPGLAPHELRHYFGTALYRATHDLLATQQALGHASPATTAGYALVDSDALARAVGSIQPPMSASSGLRPASPAA